MSLYKMLLKTIDHLGMRWVLTRQIGKLRIEKEQLEARINLLAEEADSKDVRQFYVEQDRRRQFYDLQSRFNTLEREVWEHRANARLANPQQAREIGNSLLSLVQTLNKHRVQDSVKPKFILSVTMAWESWERIRDAYYSLHKTK